MFHHSFTVSMTIVYLLNCRSDNVERIHGNAIVKSFSILSTHCNASGANHWLFNWHCDNEILPCKHNELQIFDPHSLCLAFASGLNAKIWYEVDERIVQNEAIRELNREFELPSFQSRLNEKLVSLIAKCLQCAFICFFLTIIRATPTNQLEKFSPT